MTFYACLYEIDQQGRFGNGKRITREQAKRQLRGAVYMPYAWWQVKRGARGFNTRGGKRLIIGVCDYTVQGFTWSK